MSESPNGNGRVWNMGLTGLPGVLANLTAVGVLALMFWQAQQNGFDQARVDREITREGFAEQSRAIRDNQAAVLELARSVKEVADEVRRLQRKDEVREREVKEIKSELPKKP